MNEELEVIERQESDFVKREVIRKQLVRHEKTLKSEIPELKNKLKMTVAEFTQALKRGDSEDLNLAICSFRSESGKLSDTLEEIARIRSELEK